MLIVEVVVFVMLLVGFKCGSCFPYMLHSVLLQTQYTIDTLQLISLLSLLVSNTKHCNVFHIGCTSHLAEQSYALPGKPLLGDHEGFVASNNTGELCCNTLFKLLLLLQCLP